MEELILVKPTLDHEKQARDFIQEFRDAGSEIHGSGGLENCLDDFAAWTKMIADHEKGENLKENYVPASTRFAVRKSDRKIVGTINIRHELNDFLLERGGHIGYGVRPSERRKGYATIILKLGLEKCAELGLKRVLVTCDKDNIGSARTIQKNSGALENEVTDDNGKLVQRYWISLD